jgi:hypothetical protein
MEAVDSIYGRKRSILGLPFFGRLDKLEADCSLLQVCKSTAAASGGIPLRRKTACVCSSLCTDKYGSQSPQRFSHFRRCSSESGHLVGLVEPSR